MKHVIMFKGGVETLEFFSVEISRYLPEDEYDVFWYNTCTLTNIDYLVYAKKYGIKKRIIHAHNSGNETTL